MVEENTEILKKKGQLLIADTTILALHERLNRLELENTHYKEKFDAL